MMTKIRMLLLTIVLLGVLAACGGNLALDNVENAADLEPETGETAVVEDDNSEKGVDAAALRNVSQRLGHPEPLGDIGDHTPQGRKLPGTQLDAVVHLFRAEPFLEIQRLVI